MNKTNKRRTSKKRISVTEKSIFCVCCPRKIHALFNNNTNNKNMKQ